MGMVVRKSEPTDLLPLQRLIAKASKQEEGIEESLDRFLVVENEEGALVGTVGMEKTGAYGLLRSLIVDGNVATGGLMIEFLQVALAYAKSEEVETVFALSANNIALFAPLGFEKVEEEKVPEAIRSLTHFKNVKTADVDVWAYRCSH
ncbi:GNAT family N-acetyltransferase [Shouchella shacheensis]|uniref:GNAT family N-acetyltransferase n=1 Tax=Shouchella shacheensis TaxID=1649580 RepID=UPI00073FD71D|nr:hypothetical protein [Shouchella shacheensis]